MLADHGVEDVEMIIATSVHRRMTAGEVRHMVGDRIFKAYWPDRLYSHDAEDPTGMKLVGTTDHGEVVELNRKAVEADLLIYVSLNFVPMSGATNRLPWVSAGTGLFAHHHNPHVMRNCWSYMDPGASALATSVDRMGRLVEKAIDVFHIETTVNNRMFDRRSRSCTRTRTTGRDPSAPRSRVSRTRLRSCRKPARQAIFERVPSPYGMTGVFAGECEAVHAKTLERAYAQYLVPLRGQADILVCGIPYISPYNVNSFLNPLLVQVMAQGTSSTCTGGRRSSAKGGTMIVFHPCTDLFDLSSTLRTSSSCTTSCRKRGTPR
jgi:hypothetical protein